MLLYGPFRSRAFLPGSPKNSGNIMFLRSQVEADRLNFISEILFANNTDIDTPHLFTEYRMVPQEGLLLLFPGHLSHYVEQNNTEESDDRRISLSFNFF